MTEAGPPDVSRQQRRRRVFVVFWSVAVVALLVAVRAILVPFIMALVIAYVLAPIARAMSSVRVGRWRFPNWGAVLVLYAAIVSVLFVSVRTAVPRIAAEVRDFVRDEVPRLRTRADTHWLPQLRVVGRRLVARPGESEPNVATAPDDHAIVVEPRAAGGFEVRLPRAGVQIERQSDNSYRIAPERTSADGRPRDEIDQLLDRARGLSAGHTEDLFVLGRGIVTSIVGGVFGFFITLMLSAYLLITQSRVLAFAESLVNPELRPAFHELVARVDRGLSGVVRGQLVICGVNGALSAVGFAIAHLPYWPLLALLAAVFSLVPIFGSILSAVPAVAVGLRNGVPTGLFVLIWIIGIHQLEANLLNPKIMGDSAKIHPVLVVFSLIAGEHFFGILGALLAVPTMSLVQSVFLHWRAHALDGATTVPDTGG